MLNAEAKVVRCESKLAAAQAAYTQAKDLATAARVGHEEATTLVQVVSQALSSDGARILY